MNETPASENSVSFAPDRLKWFKWLRELCKGNDVEYPEDLPLSEVDDEIVETTVVLEIELEWHDTSNSETFILTLMEYLSVLMDLRGRVLAKKA